MNDPQLVIVLKNTSLGSVIRTALTDSEQLGEPLHVKLTVSGHEIEAHLQVLSGPSPVYGGPRNATTLVLCAVEPERKTVQVV